MIYVKTSTPSYYEFTVSVFLSLSSSLPSMNNKSETRLRYIKTLLLYNCPFSRSSTTLLSAVLTVGCKTKYAELIAADVTGQLRAAGSQQTLP